MEERERVAAIVCVRVPYIRTRVHTYTRTLLLHPRARARHIRTHTHVDVRTSIRTRKSPRESSSMCRTSMRVEEGGKRTRRRMAEGGRKVRGFEGGYEGMSGGRACMWAPCFVRVKPRRRYGTLEA